MKNIILTSIVFNILYNYQEVFNRFNFHNLSAAEAFLLIAKNIIISQIAVSSFFLLISFNKIFYRILVPIIFMLSNLIGGAKIMYGIVLDQNLIISIFETSLRKSSEFIDTMFIQSALISLVIGAFLSSSPSFRDLRKISWPVLLLSLLLFLSGVYINTLKINANFMPYNFIKEISSYLYAKQGRGTRSEIDYQYLSQNNNEDLLVVLVIGESARSDHFGINGYERDTTPNLAQINNLKTYKNARSCAASTHISVLCMLTRATENDRAKVAQEESFISLFKKLGFKTLWIGSQGNSKIDHLYHLPAKEADKSVFAEDLFGDKYYDHDMLKYIEEFTRESGNKLVIFHTIGSHFDYNLRYPQDFACFTPVENRINSYDNTIYYTDYVLSSLIKIIENKNSFLLYSSDHGESLGENGVFFHGQDYIKEQRAVPFMIYASPKYINTYPKFDNLKAPHEVSHDNIFHTILDCANIESDIIDKQLSLCKK